MALILFTLYILHFLQYCTFSFIISIQLTSWDWTSIYSQSTTSMVVAILHHTHRTPKKSSVNSVTSLSLRQYSTDTELFVQDFRLKIEQKHPPLLLDSVVNGPFATSCPNLYTRSMLADAFLHSTGQWLLSNTSRTKSSICPKTLDIMSWTILTCGKRKTTTKCLYYAIQNSMPQTRTVLLLANCQM